MPESMSSGDQNFIREGNYWVFDDGIKLPVISGGSDTMSSGDPGAGGDPVDPGAAQGTQPQGDFSNLSPFGQNFIQGVPENERGIVAKYLPQWDAGFTKHSQRLNQELSQYKQLGDPHTLQQAHSVYQQLVNDPAEVARFLVEQGYYTPKQAAQAVSQAQQGDPSGLPPEIQDKLSKYDTEFNRMQRALGIMAERTQSLQQQREAEEAARQLDSWMTDFQKKNPGIPEVFVLSMLQAGLDEPSIVNQWNGVSQQIVNQRAAKTPPNINGASSQPQFAQNPADMTVDQRKQALVSRLDQLMGS